MQPTAPLALLSPAELSCCERRIADGSLLLSPAASDANGLSPAAPACAAKLAWAVDVWRLLLSCGGGGGGGDGEVAHLSVAPDAIADRSADGNAGGGADSSADEAEDSGAPPARHR